MASGVLLTNADNDMGNVVWRNGYKICSHHCEIMVVNTKYVSCVHRGVDDSQQIFLPLHIPMVSIL
jgi:hypothetical protein